MAFESFYGGKQGISPVIKASFATRVALQNAFDNINYKDVWYSELAIIDTSNKLDKDNGKLYRRTLKTTTQQTDIDKYAGPHAEYIGQIVGPAGKAPYIVLSSEEEIKNALTASATTTVAYPTNDSISYTKPESTATTNLQYKSTTSATLIPGYISGTTPAYNDNIQYTWANIIDGENDPAWVHLGFKIPYSVFEFNANTVTYTATATINEDTNSEEHPFYWKYNINIPQGRPGVWTEVKIGNRSDSTWGSGSKILYSSNSELNYTDSDDTYSLINGESITVNELPEAQFWYLELQCPKKDGTFQKLYRYIEPHTTMSTITFNDNSGDFIFTDNAGGTVTVATNANYIKDIHGNRDKNEFYVLYSSEKYRYPEKYDTITPTTSSKITTLDNKIWIKDADGTENGLWWELLSPLTSVERFGIQTEIDFSTRTSGYIPTPIFSNIPATSNEVLACLNSTTATFNPYANGKDGYGHDIEGQLIYYSEEYTIDNKIHSVGYAYYWDINTEQWKYAGAWVDGTGGSGSKIQVYKWDNTITPSGNWSIDANDTALGFIKETITTTTFDWPVIPNA